MIYGRHQVTKITKYSGLRFTTAEATKNEFSLAVTSFVSYSNFILKSYANSST